MFFLAFASSKASIVSSFGIFTGKRIPFDHFFSQHIHDFHRHFCIGVGGRNGVRLASLQKMIRSFFPFKISR